MIKSLFVFISLYSTLYGQNTVTTIKVKRSIPDTINYLYMEHFGGFRLFKIEDKTTQVIQNCPKDLWFMNPVDSFFLRNHVLISGQTLKVSDTLVNMFWYHLKNVGCVSEICSHVDYIWKLRLNRKSNVIVTERLFCAKDKKLARLYFKVIKFSDFEIILQDLQIKPLTRLYYFRARRTN